MTSFAKISTLALVLVSLVLTGCGRISVSTDQTTYVPRADITIKISISKKQIGDQTWVGVVPASTSHEGGVDPDDIGLSYWQVKNIQGGKAVLTAPLAVGSYDVRIYSSEDISTGTELATTGFVVTESGEPDVQTGDLP